jgi:hypothetical protein
VTDTEAQTWMAGSTVEGNLSCTDTDFDHFQFSATVHGDADFTGTEYDSNATFTSSTFNGRVWFDDALFTGHPDFSKSQFTEEVSFEGTEFMVEPSFEETRFATNPELDKAEFLTDIDASMEERYRKWELILVHPESLENTGVSIHASEVSEGFGIPVDLTHLAEEDPKKTNSFDSILKDIDSSSWSDVISNALPKARTAVTRLEDGKTGTVVYGVEFGENADSPEEAIQEVAVACVYELQGDTFEFTHISTEMSEFDYLVPVPISDDTFEGGAEVATKKETRKAMMRHERFRLRQLVRGESLETDEGPSVHKAVAPLLAAAGKV